MQHLAANHDAVALADDDRRDRLVAEALAVLAVERHDATVKAHQFRVGLNAARAAVGTSASDIRWYLIELHRSDVVSRDVLDRFLNRFAMDPYQPRVRVLYRIAGQYDLDADDLRRARADAEAFLRPHLDDIPNLVPHSGNQQVNVTHVGHID